jgi:hypothetical protein
LNHLAISAGFAHDTNFAHLQRRGMLIENDDLATASQRFGDGNELAFGVTQLIDPDAGIKRKTKLRWS